MKCVFLFFLLFPIAVLATNPGDTAEIRVHFLYGSKPSKKCKEKEEKYFGGLHGGHVTIEAAGINVGFNPIWDYHIFPHKKHKSAAFALTSLDEFKKDSVEMKYVSFIIKKTPYDYSYFGMRCASATWDILEEAGIVKRRSKIWKAWVIFYPKRIRKRMFRYAEKNDWEVVAKDGRDCRIWEKD
jgi:hypothetical protein